MLSKSVNKDFLIAEHLADQLLEIDSVREFMRKHGISRVRHVRIVADPSQEGWYQIPVLDHGASRRFVRLFRPETNPKQELKDRLLSMMRQRSGYTPGDIFESPWGRFLVTDAGGLKEI